MATVILFVIGILGVYFLGVVVINVRASIKWRLESRRRIERLLVGDSSDHESRGGHGHSHHGGHSDGGYWGAGHAGGGDWGAGGGHGH